jgi:soluble lytic murein transglycosylase-like protein
MYRLFVALVFAFFCSQLLAESIYRYKGPNGEVVFSDKKLDKPGYTLVSHSKNGTYIGKLATPATLPSKKVVKQMIAATAKRYQLDPKLLSAIIATESSFKVDAISPSGAVGLMQLMPDTANDYAIAELMDPEANLDAGARHLVGLFTEFKELDIVLAAYNAGAGNVRRYGGVPPFAQTKRYIEKIKRYMAKH